MFRDGSVYFPMTEANRKQLLFENVEAFPSFGKPNPSKTTPNKNINTCFLFKANYGNKQSGVQKVRPI
jgi:hypothetical protein